MKIQTAFLVTVISLLQFATIVLKADEPIVVGRKTKENGEFVLTRIKDGSQTTLEVAINQSPSAVWSKTLIMRSPVANSLDYWQLVDGCLQGTGNPITASFLLSMTVGDGLLWVNATRTDGQWHVNFEQELWKVASTQLKTAKVGLQDVNSVAVTNADGITTLYTRNAAGEVFRDGLHYENHSPWKQYSP